MKFSGTCAVVTGATSGIGAAVARRMCAEGATVFGLARRADALAEEAKLAEGRLVPVPVDLADAGARTHAIEMLLARTGRIDVLVNNAGQATFDGPLALGAARWQALFEINLHAAIDLSLALAPRLPRGGHIINISSVTARFTPQPRFAAYAATKAALDRATEALRLELDPRGIHVTTLAPGLCDTPIYDSVEGFDATRERLHKQVPRWLDPSDVADALMWVVSRPPHVVVSDLVLLPSGQGR
jgi:NAD(P)-dependent dehydrogenase (short-subunit alcohol dehydrogenase family)